MSDMTSNTESGNSELKLFDDSPIRTEPFQVEVVRSKKRRRSVSAQMHGDILRVSIPSWMSKTEEATNVAEMVRRFKRKLPHKKSISPNAREFLPSVTRYILQTILNGPKISHRCGDFVHRQQKAFVCPLALLDFLRGFLIT